MRACARVCVRACMYALMQARTVLEHRDQQKQTMIKELVTLRESNEDSRNAAARMAEIELSQEEELERVKQKVGTFM